MTHMLKVGDNDTPSGVATMKAVVVSKYGRSATRAMSMRDDFPRPVRPGPSEVIIQVQAAGLNKMDIAKAKGQMKSLLGEETLPYAVGYDFSGVVERVGSEVTLFRPGEEVYGCRAPALEDEMDKRRRPYGTLAEFCICDESEVAHKPWTLTHEQTAAVPMAALTAIQAFETARFKPKSRRSIFIMGGGSGVGNMAMQLAKEEYGATRIVAAVKPMEDAAVASVISRDESSGWPSVKVLNDDSEVAKMRGFRNFDMVLDNEGAADWLMDLKLLNSTGVCISTAAPATAKEVSGLYEPSGMARYMMDRKAAKYHEAAMRAGVEYHRIFPISSGQLLEAVMNPLLESGRVRPIIDSCHTFEHYGRAMRILRGGWPRGKVVVRVAPPSAMPEPYKLKEGHAQPVSLMMRSTAPVGKIKKPRKRVVRPAFGATAVREEYDRATPATQPRSPVELAPYNEEEEEEEEEEEMKLEEPETATKPELPELSGCPFPSGMPEAAKKAFMRPKHVTMDKPWEAPAKHRRRAASEPRQPPGQQQHQQQQQQPQQQQPLPANTLSPTAQKRQASIEAGARDVLMVHSRGGY